MNQSVVAAALAGYLGGLLVSSRTLAWLALLCANLRARATAKESAGGWLIPLVAHSGPWLLVIAATAIRYVATSTPPEMLWALVGGLAAAFAFLSFLKIRVPPRRDEPLTPQRLAQIRQEFFLTYVGLVTLGAVAIPGFFYWNTLDRDYPLVIVIAVVAPVAGYLNALVLWQWKSALLQVAEKRRRQQAQLEVGAAVATDVAAPR
jgi:hypothetical protein